LLCKTFIQNKLMKKNNTDTLQVIFVPVEIKKRLQKEFDTTNTTINLALKHVNNSDFAKRIRRRAKELMQIEIEKIKD